MCGMKAVAQDSYSEALKALVNANPSMGANFKADDMKASLKQVNQMVMKDYNESDSNELIEKYLKTQFMSDIINRMMLPSFKKHVTEDELRELTALITTPEGQAFSKESAEIMKKPEAVGEMTKQVMAMAMSVMKNEELAPVKANANIPQDYVELWDRYYDGGGMSSLVEPIFSTMEKQFSQSGGKEFGEKLSSHMKSNFKVVMMNMSYGTMSKAALEFGVKYVSTTAGKHAMDAAVDMMSGDLQQLGMQLMVGYGEWLEEQGVELKEDLE